PCIAVAGGGWVGGAWRARFPARHGGLQSRRARLVAGLVPGLRRDGSGLSGVVAEDGSHPRDGLRGVHDWRAHMWVAGRGDVPKDGFMYTLPPARAAMLTEGPTDEEKALAAQHWAYSQELLQRRTILFGGRMVERTSESFAICVIRADSEEQARGF